MPIEYDPRKAAANLRKHSISFDEAASSLLDPCALVRHDPDAPDEARFVLVGMSNKARLLTVCYTLRQEDTVRLISGRKSTQRERNQYAKRI